MKKIILYIAVIAFILSGCGSNQSAEQSKEAETHDHGDGKHAHDEKAGTHMHLDGTVHEDHADEPKQEEFTVTSDTADATFGKEHTHTHEEGAHSHPH